MPTTAEPFAALTRRAEFTDPGGAAQRAQWRFCVAPMLDCTDRHARYFLRLLSRRARLYTEMVTAAALLHGDRERLLRFHTREQPVALQLGGSDPGQLAEAAAMGAAAGYQEINLNVGCPSTRVQSGAFGACLMLRPRQVAHCVGAMQRAVRVPVTVKCRIGVDDQDSLALLCRFVGQVADAGCRVFMVHARKAWLKGLSPKQNRQLPPLDHARVRQLKAAFPGLTVVLNGGLAELIQAQEALTWADGVMLGRAAYHNPWLLSAVDGALFGDNHPPPTRAQVVAALLPYWQGELTAGVRLRSMIRHLQGLFHGQPGARLWRRTVSNPGEGVGPEEILALAQRLAGQARETARPPLAGDRTGSAHHQLVTGMSS